MNKKKIVPILLGVAVGTVGGAVTAGKIMNKGIDQWKELADKNCALFLLMNKWMRTKQEGRHIKEYFEENGYMSVAVYGLSHVGKCLLEELKDCDVEIKFAVDRNAAAVCSDIEVYSPEDELPMADVMIVTAVFHYNEICNNLKDKVSYPVVSLEDILFGFDRKGI